MTAYAAFLRAMNVGGTGKLPMAELRRMGTACGFANVRTYIASGNLLFESTLSQDDARDAICKELEAFFGKAVPVFVRSVAELDAIVAANPFPDEKGSRLMVFFLAEAATPAMLAEARGHANERMAIGKREIYVAYGDGIRTTKLVIPAVKQGTARNINTVSKVAAMLRSAA
jgi:uncharacterized protein (DUF1697 family)